MAAAGLAVLVYCHSRQDPRHWTYGLFGLTTAIWSFGYFAWQMTETYESALLFVRILMAGAIFIPVTFYHHVVVLRNKLESNRALLKSSYLVGGFFLLTDLTPFFVADVQPALFFPFWPKPGPLFHVFLIWWGGIVVYAHYLLWQGYCQEKGLRRRQYFYLLVASSIGYAGGATNFPLWYGIDLPPFGTIFFTFYIALVAYTLLRYHLMDYSVFVERGMSYLALLVLISQPVYPVLLLAQKSFFGAISFRFSLVQLFIHLLTVAGAYQMKVGTRGAIARTVLRGRQFRFQTLKQFSNNIVESGDLKSLGEEIVHSLLSGLRSQVAILFILDQNKEKYVPVSAHGTSLEEGSLPRFCVTDELPRHLAIVKNKIIVEEIKQAFPDEWKKKVIDDLSDLKADICVPFISKNRLLGFCTIGRLPSRSWDETHELGLLTTLMQEAAMALENALLREEVKRSYDLVNHMDRLRSLETMAGGLAQELHNPLKSIKSFVQLAQLRKNDEEFLRRFRSVVSEDVARIEQLTKEIREYALLSDPKFVEEDVNEILRSCLSFIAIHPVYQNLSVDQALASGLPRVPMDRQQIKQVFFNILLHMVKVMTQGDRKGSLSIKSQTIGTSTGESWIQVEISGTNEEIVINNDAIENNLPDSSRLNPTNGLSLDQGLDIADQILQTHHGHIRTYSGVGGAPAFSVFFPVHFSKLERRKISDELRDYSQEWNPKIPPSAFD